MDSIIGVAVVEQNVFRKFGIGTAAVFPRLSLWKPCRMMVPVGPFFEPGQCVIGTAETLHCWDLVETRTDGVQFGSQTIPRKGVPAGPATIDDGSTANNGMGGSLTDRWG
jgi:hypothetical protein